MADFSDELIPTRATLLHRLKNWQDQASWQDFFDIYGNLIYGVSIKSGLIKAEAQDVVQETMLAVAKHMPGFKYDPAIGSFKGWLMNLTRWRILDQIRKRGPARAEIEFSDRTPTGDSRLDPLAKSVLPELEQLWDAEWEKTLLAAALARVRRRLDPKQFQIFDCAVNKEWPPEKTAAALAVSVDQVYLAKHRVTEMIRQEVERLKKDTI